MGVIRLNYIATAFDHLSEVSSPGRKPSVRVVGEHFVKQVHPSLAYVREQRPEGVVPAKRAINRPQARTNKLNKNAGFRL